jgi:Flp pilus assembly protein TadG
LKSKMRRLFLGSDQGQSLLEFALVLPLLLLVLFGITEFGRAIMVTNVLNSASREAAILVAYGDSVLVSARVAEVLEAANVNPEAITMQTMVIDGINYVEVIVTADFEILSGTILKTFAGTFTLKGRTVMRRMI